MDAAIMRRIALVALCLLASCKGVGLGQLDTTGPETPPGLSNFDLPSASEEDDKWFGGFMGKSHGFGWSTDKADSPNCDYYSTCKGSQQDPTGQGDDRGGGMGW